MEKERLNHAHKLSQKGRDGYLIVPNYFLKRWVKVLGIGPALLYLELLTYCHKEKDLIWPTLSTLSNNLGISKNSLISYQKILLKYRLIKKIERRKSAKGNYLSNLYKITPLEGAKFASGVVQNLGRSSSNIAPGVVQNLHPNNNHIEHYPYNNQQAAVADFKKRKGEEKMKTLREQLQDLDFKESFIEKLLKDFDLKKIEEKLDLLLVRRNIQNPTGWLYAALKNDYQDPQSSLSFPPSPLSFPPSPLSFPRKRESIKSPHQESIDLRENPPEPASLQEALKAIRLIRKNLSSLSPGGRGPG